MKERHDTRDVIIGIILVLAFLFAYQRLGMGPKDPYRSCLAKNIDNCYERFNV